MTDLARPTFLNPPFTLTYELNPPRSADAAGVVAHAKDVAPHVDAFNVTDCPLSNLRMSPGPVAARIQQETGRATIPHVTGRDRNLLALQSELLGWSWLGIRHLFCLTGDPVKIGDHPYAKGVYELYANQLIELARTLNGGHDHAGHALKPATDFAPGAAVTLSDARPEARDTFAKKIEAGAEFFQTQVVLDPATLDSAAARSFTTDKPVLVGTIPLRGPKALAGLKQVPGIEITDVVERRLKNATDFAAEANRIVIDLRDAVKGRYAGLHLMPIAPDPGQIHALLAELSGRRARLPLRANA